MKTLKTLNLTENELKTIIYALEKSMQHTIFGSQNFDKQEAIKNKLKIALK